MALIVLSIQDTFPSFLRETHMIDVRRARAENYAKAAHLIRTLRAGSYSYGYIAEALDRAGIQTLCGRPGACWRRGAAHAIAQREGIA